MAVENKGFTSDLSKNRLQITVVFITKICIKHREFTQVAFQFTRITLFRYVTYQKVKSKQYKHKEAKDCSNKHKKSSQYSQCS